MNEDVESAEGGAGGEGHGDARRGRACGGAVGAGHSWDGADKADGDDRRGAAEHGEGARVIAEGETEDDGDGGGGDGGDGGDDAHRAGAETFIEEGEAASTSQSGRGSPGEIDGAWGAGEGEEGLGEEDGGDADELRGDDDSDGGRALGGEAAEEVGGSVESGGDEGEGEGHGAQSSVPGCAARVRRWVAGGVVVPWFTGRYFALPPHPGSSQGR